MLYDIPLSTGNPAIYGLRFRLHFSAINQALRNRIKNKVKQVKDDIRTLYMKIKIYKSYSNGIPGACQPAVIEEIVEK